MAKKSSSVFYLRKYAETNAGTAATADIDISAYIDTLKGNVLRINQVWFEWTSDDGSPIDTADVGVDASTSAGAQLCTESQTALQPLTNTSLVAKHQIYLSTDNQSGTNNFIMFHEDRAMNPADFDSGFLVANDTIQLLVQDSPAPHVFANPVRCSVILECEQVKMSAADAQAILLSQAIG
tara:strand:+ start:99 stop:641 length:543 start_codon:yes stop_codon:yes gene_type:complete